MITISFEIKKDIFCNFYSFLKLFVAMVPARKTMCADWAFTHKKMVLTGIYAVTIPSRFLTLLAHFFIAICLLWDKVSTSYKLYCPFHKFDVFVSWSSFLQEENFRLCLFKYDAEYAGFYYNEYKLTY